eukprot:Pgem_evm1s20258
MTRRLIGTFDLVKEFQVGFFTFNSKQTLELPLTSDRNTINNKLNSMNFPRHERGTKLGTALQEVDNQILSRTQRYQSQKVLVLYCDGEVYENYEVDLLNRMGGVYNSKNYIVFAVLIGESINFKQGMLEKIATPARTLYVNNFDDLQNQFQKLNQNIQKELCNRPPPPEKPPCTYGVWEPLYKCDANPNNCYGGMTEIQGTMTMVQKGSSPECPEKRDVKGCKVPCAECKYGDWETEDCNANVAFCRDGQDYVKGESISRRLSTSPNCPPDQTSDPCQKPCPRCDLRPKIEKNCSVSIQDCKEGQSTVRGNREIIQEPTDDCKITIGYDDCEAKCPECQYTTWTEWSTDQDDCVLVNANACSVPGTRYATGFIHRTRESKNSVVPGICKNVDDKKVCTVKCETPCKYTKWEFGECNATCPDNITEEITVKGQKPKTRKIDGLSEGCDETEDVDDCSIDCDPCEYKDWDHSGECVYTQECAEGIEMIVGKREITRTKSAGTGICEDQKQDEDCNKTCIQPPVDCVMSEWEDGGCVGAHCIDNGEDKAKGQRKRTRKIEVFPRNNGLACNKTIEYVECFEPCKVDCVFDDSEMVEPCSAKCDESNRTVAVVSGFEVWERKILRNASNGGMACTEIDIVRQENRDCTAACPVDCKLNETATDSGDCDAKCPKVYSKPVIKGKATWVRNVVRKAVNNGKTCEELGEKQSEIRECSISCVEPDPVSDPHKPREPSDPPGKVDEYIDPDPQEAN